jgi:hypothetical protein
MLYFVILKLIIGNIKIISNILIEVLRIVTKHLIYKNYTDLFAENFEEKGP